MLSVRVRNGSELVFEDPPGVVHLVVTLMRTLRVPDDGNCYPLPAGIGAFPVRDARDYAGRVPDQWLQGVNVFVPMSGCEALWIALDSQQDHPNAIKVAAGRVNALSGRPWRRSLSRLPPTSFMSRLLGRTQVQDYIVCPPQCWLDGFNTGYSTVRQFVAVPLGQGRTVEGQVTGSEEHGGIQLLVYQPKPGPFPHAAATEGATPREIERVSQSGNRRNRGLLENRRFRIRAIWYLEKSLTITIHKTRQ